MYLSLVKSSNSLNSLNLPIVVSAINLVFGKIEENPRKEKFIIKFIIIKNKTSNKTAADSRQAKKATQSVHVVFITL
jgi:hypothetical protein